MSDPALARRLSKLQSILDVAKAMTAERQLDRLLALVVDEAAKVAEADRCTLFLADRERGELWSKVAHGAEPIRIPLGAGIAGAVAASGVPIRIDDAYADARFNDGVDRGTGYRTRNILAVPMRNSSPPRPPRSDALTASDRPYKKAMPPERALDLLADEARRGQIDAPLLGVFVDAGVWRETVRPR